MGAVLWDAKVGDTLPITATLRERPTTGQRTAPPFNLTGATVTVYARREYDRAIVYTATATITDAVNGKVATTLTTAVTGQPGLVSVEFVATLADTSQRSWPAEALTDYWYLRVRGDLSGTPVAASPVVEGALPPVIIAPGGIGGPVEDGQLVFAGAGSTITFPTNVTWAQIGWSGTGAPWDSTTVPTIQQTGSTVAGGMSTQLLASGGNLVIVTKVGTVLTPLSTGRATIWAHNGTGYAPDPDARLFEQVVGEPDPTGLADNDILLQQNP